MSKIIGFFVCAALAAGCADRGAELCKGTTGACKGFGAGASESSVSTVFNTAASGTTLIFDAGTFSFTNTLSCPPGINNLTIKGAGIDQTILDFKGQLTGSQAVSCNVSNVTFVDLTVQDSLGDALKVEGATGVTFRRVKINWTKPSNENHGPYGLYPVQCTNVLIEDSIVVGAADAGFYIGQSENVIVRRNKAYNNVAGIEIENTFYADVTENESYNNTAGILVFSLPIPESPKQTTKSVRVFNNMIHDNNGPNFAKLGSIVGRVPSGVGTLTMAADQVEVYGNTITNHRTIHSAVVSYFLADLNWMITNLPSYSPFPTNVYIHNNIYTGKSTDPDQENISMVGVALKATPFTGGFMPAIAWDGVDGTGSPFPPPGTTPNFQKICIGGNTGDVSWANLNAAQQTPGMVGFDKVSEDPAPFTCTLPSVPAVTIPGA